MSRMRRIVLVRHGETVGNSKLRYHGRTDVALSEEGRAQMRAAAFELRTEAFELVVASPLQRSWESARIVSGGAPVHLDAGLREVDFGRWEGMTSEEIEASDPILYADWRSNAPGFVYPGGEARAEFRARVERSLSEILQGGAAAALVVVHKGVIRVIVEKLTGAPLAEGEPPLGGAVGISRDATGTWFVGRHGSNPLVA